MTTVPPAQPPAAPEGEVNRLRNWAKAYQRLMRGGLDERAHTACVDDFADDEGEYPYITADDVLTLLARAESAEAALAELRAGVEALADEWGENDALLETLILAIPSRPGSTRADRAREFLPVVQRLMAQSWDECATWLDSHDPDVEDVRAANRYRVIPPASTDTTGGAE